MPKTHVPLQFTLPSYHKSLDRFLLMLLPFKAGRVIGPEAISDI